MTGLVNSLLLRFILIGCVLELFYILVFALTPLFTVQLKLSPLGMGWSWTLAPSQLLFHSEWNLTNGFADPSLYFLLLGLTFIAISIVYLCAVVLAYHASNKNHITSGWIFLPLLGATIFGITLLFLPVLFSNEVYSYIFSGRMLSIYHVDPMQIVPAQFQLDPYFAWIPQPNVPKIYGPVWMAIASLLVSVGSSPIVTLLLFKILALLSHLINCVLIWIILGKLAPSRRLVGTLLYAWNPLALIELAGNGHNDGLLICLLLLATLLYVQQKGGWYDIGAMALLGLAISFNLIGLLFVPLFIWFSVHNEPRIGHAIWGFCWRAMLTLGVTFILYLPFWHGSATFVAIISSIDMQHFAHSLLAILVVPLRQLYSLIAQQTHFQSSLMQPISAADTTVVGSAMFIFALIYFSLLGKVRKAPVNVSVAGDKGREGMEGVRSAKPSKAGTDFDVLFTSLSIAILGFIVLVPGIFWPWYVLWVLWIVALRRFDALTVSVILLSCTALFTYPLLYLENSPIALFQPLLIFGIPLVYLIANVLRRNERKGSNMTDEVRQRKIEHVSVALGQDISVAQRANWNDIQFVHQALPEVDLDEIDTSVNFFSHTLRYPIFMSSLTGGHPDVISINRNLARAAEQYGLALGVGSQRAAIVNPDVTSSYAITRESAPNTFLIANIGAPQLIAQSRHAPFTIKQVEHAIDMIGANALAVHMNSLQEAAQPEGDRRAAGEAAALKELTSRVDIPVIAKETGAGVCREQALLLRSCGVAAIDVGGAGGSSMSAMEAARSEARGDEKTRNIGLLYRDWGIATPVSIVESSVARLPLISTGGVRNGLDMARALALGATLVGMGFPFLKAASKSYQAVCELLETIVAELKVAMQLSGAAAIGQLQQTDIVVTGETRNWLTMRGFEEELRAMAQRRWSQMQGL